jgi:hypothetical protein
MAEIETAPISLKAQRFDLGDTLYALLVQVVFQ